MKMKTMNMIKWYMVINNEDKIVGNVYINKKNTIAYHIIKKISKAGIW